MTEYRITFGVQYKREPHPTLPFVDPDGYLVVDAATGYWARVKFQEHYGLHYAFIYTPEQCTERWEESFPHGEFGRMLDDGSIKWNENYTDPRDHPGILTEKLISYSSQEAEYHAEIVTTLDKVRRCGDRDSSDKYYERLRQLVEVAKSRRDAALDVSEKLATLAQEREQHV